MKTLRCGTDVTRESALLYPWTPHRTQAGRSRVGSATMTFPDQYWSSFEHRVDSLSAFLEAVIKVSAYQAETGTRFAWRGVKDSDHPLHSSLFQEFVERHARQPTERQLREFEQVIIAEARAWGLDWHSTGGRLTALELLAALQHYGVPTRMFDFTFNPLTALWFAVEDDRNGAAAGRIFAIDISDRVVEREQWTQAEPWWNEIDQGALTESPAATGGGRTRRPRTPSRRASYTAGCPVILVPIQPLASKDSSPTPTAA
jgi:hypothetical protein